MKSFVLSFSRTQHTPRIGVVAALLIYLTSIQVKGQSFNIDVGTEVAGAPGRGAPATSFAGAAGQIGNWNEITGTTTGPFLLVGLDGSASGASVTRSTGTGGNFGFKNQSATGNYAKLLNDAQDIGGVGQSITYTFDGLAVGAYQVFTYAVAPDNADYRVNVDVTGHTNTPTQTVGGAIPRNTFLSGETHSTHNVAVGNGDALVIAVATTTGFGRVSGIQVRKIQFTNRCFVHAAASGANDGTDWVNALTDLQSALNAASIGACGEIWVAAGNYNPSQRTSPLDPRSATFRLFNTVALYGGFSGIETSLSQRDPVVNVTTLNGNIDNVYHVVTASNTDASAVLDGFIISGGIADLSHRPGLSSCGAGMLIDSGSPTIANCTFSGNRAFRGAGVYNYGGNPTLTNCAFGGNSVEPIFQVVEGSVFGYLGSGGGFCNVQGGAILDGCTFTGNEARWGDSGWPWFLAAECDAGGVYNESGVLTLSNCIFLENYSAGIGGGMGNMGECVLVSCDFLNNEAGAGGGLAVGGLANTSVMNCNFIGNHALAGGGAYVHGLNWSPFFDCVFVGNSADNFGDEFASNFGNPTINDLTLRGRDASPASSAYISYSTLTLTDPLGGLVLDGGTSARMDLRRSVIAGPGTLRVETGATLRVLAGDASTFEPATIRTNVVGTGEILVGAGQELLVEGGAVVDMGGASGGGCADPAQASNWGRIEVNGQLVVRDSTIRNTNVDVLSGDLSDLTEVHNNQINLLQNPPGWGGEFYVEGTSTIECNVIYSEGDRYLDLDPDPLASPRPTINENKFNVSILQGTSIPQGELLELRSVDYDNGLGGELSGAYELAASSAPSPGGYTDTWVLEQLEIRPNAKVNLTNRQGFVFQDPQITIPEAIYVKEIKLHPGAVLNTGHQRLYYQTLVDETGAPLARDPQDPSAPMSNGSRIIDVPLLGFSLKVIAMEDQTEFDVRVQKRLRDPADLQPPFPPFKEGAITREVGLDPQNPANGVMKIKTKASGSLQASSAAAHGAFARAGEAEILVQFRYRFCGQTTDELIVYLTDSPEVSQNLVEVARVRPPASGPGSIDSGTYATFSGNFPRGNLNFLRGTYVELELRGPDACVLIDDWDPVVCPYCGQCGDLNQDCGVTDLDYLYLLSEFGQPVRNANLCADVLSSDNYIDMSDLLALAGALSSYPVPLNLCGNGSGGGGTVCGEELPATCEDPPSESLLIAGKPGGAGLRDALAHNDTLYGVNAQTYAAGPGVPAPAQSGGLRRGHGRLMTDSLGRLHQVHGILGLIRLTDGVAVVKPAPKSYLGDTVRIGRTTGGGYPLADAAFDPNDPDMVYVAPVHITPAGGGLPYRAVAKLRLSGNGNFELVRTYGANPADTPEIECINCTEIVYQNDASRIREIEVDSYGNLFVASALEVNDYNYLLIYPADGGSEIRVPLTGQVQAPSALHVSGDKLYVSTSLDALDHASAVIHRYNIIRAGRNATLLEHDTDIPVVGIRHLTAMTTNPADGTLWAVGFYSSACSTAQCAADPDCSGGCDFPYQESDSIFTTPKVVIIANPATTPVVQEVATLGGSDLALPLSVIFQDVPCGTGDFDGGGLGESDIVPFVNALLSPTPADLCPGDMNHDSIFDGRDIQIFIASLTP